MKFVFLYTELAGYIVNCFNELANTRNKVHVFYWEVNAEAPFEFDLADGVELYSRKKYNNQADLFETIRRISPDKIICSGWVDSVYLKICSNYKTKIPTILALDNQWNGSFKQILGTLIAPFFLRTKFSHAWVPGDKQYRYAEKLGFESDHIEKGFYTANVELFHKFYLQNKEAKEQNFPKVILYVGRYVEHKGIFDLWRAFLETNEETVSDWELWCVGTGQEFENRMKHKSIKHFGFLQPKDMNEVISKSGVYILPSHFEPWGVTLQEFALSGLPLLVSDKVGSSEVFLEENINGYSFKSGDVSSIKTALKKIFNMEKSSLIKFQAASSRLGNKINVDLWVSTIMKFKNV